MNVNDQDSQISYLSKKSEFIYSNVNVAIQSIFGVFSNTLSNV